MRITQHPQTLTIILKVQSISTTGYRIQDKYQTHQDIVNYLNQYTQTLWDWKYRSNC